MVSPDSSHHYRCSHVSLTPGNRASYGHGVPPHISRNQYDVPLPTISVLVPQANPTQQRVRTAHCYIALCQLTEILGDLLPLVYGLQPRPSKETSKILRRIRSDLDRWEDSLPDWLKVPQDQDTPSTSGASSMQLAFLALKMLVCRVELQVSLHTSFASATASKSS